MSVSKQKKEELHPWNQIITSLPSPHLLQTWEWGQLKARYGWQPFHLDWDDQTAI